MRSRAQQALVAVLNRTKQGVVRACVPMPPRHGATTALRDWTADALRADPELTVLYVASRPGLASRWRRGLASPLRSRVRSIGVLGAVVGEGYRLMLFDNLYLSMADGMHERTRHLVQESFDNLYSSRQVPEGTSVVVTGPRFHRCDLTGTLTGPRVDGAHSFELLNVPALDAWGSPTGHAFSAKKLDHLRCALGPVAWETMWMGRPS